MSSKGLVVSLFLVPVKEHKQWKPKEDIKMLYLFLFHQIALWIALHMCIKTFHCSFFFFFFPQCCSFFWSWLWKISNEKWANLWAIWHVWCISRVLALACQSQVKVLILQTVSPLVSTRVSQETGIRKGLVWKNAYVSGDWTWFLHKITLHLKLTLCVCVCVIMLTGSYY